MESNPLRHSEAFDRDPQAVRQMGEAFLEEILRWWSGLENGPVHPEVDLAHFAELISAPLPEEGSSLPELLEECRRLLEPGLTRVASPRYLGMMNPAPHLASVFAESLRAAYNQNCSLWHQSPSGTELERTVVRWLSELAGLPAETSFGTLVSGGSIANITAIKLARTHCLGTDSRQFGIWGQEPACVYASAEAHYSFEKAMDFLGMGLHHLRQAPVDSSYRVDVAALREMIETDREQGLRTACVVGIAGSTNTGAVDPLDDLADLAREFGAWYHVDAAYGGAALLLPELEELFRGISRADSVTMDPHKWFSIPFEGAALLVRDRATLHRDFDLAPHYYIAQGEGEEDRINFFQYGLQGSRSFKALKIWFAFRFLGMAAYRENIRRSLSLARRFHGALSRTGDFELFHEPSLSILCCRARPSAWVAEGSDGIERLDRLNRALYRRLETEGRFWISITRLGDRGLALRVNFHNHRARNGEADELVAYLSTLVEEEASRV